MCTTVCSVRFEFIKRQPVLENSPLKLVICQMRYPRQMGIGEEDMRPVQQALAARYPAVQVSRAAEMQLTPAGIAPGGASEPVFQFRSDDGAWTVTATRDSASLETTAYVDFTDFATRWYETSSAIVDALDLTRQDRVGLRYVDELKCSPRPTPDQIARIVRAELVGVVGAHPRTQSLLSSMQELRFAQERGVCTLRHGLVVRDGGDSAYVLDMDFYDDTPQPLDLEAQVQRLAGFNHGAYELFEWAIPPEHFATFQPKEPASA
jgi:uncharacterized protein (TIGR04255 family)